MGENKVMKCYFTMQTYHGEKSTQKFVTCYGKCLNNGETEPDKNSKKNFRLISFNNLMDLTFWTYPIILRNLILNLNSLFQMNSPYKALLRCKNFTRDVQKVKIQTK